MLGVAISRYLQKPAIIAKITNGCIYFKLLQVIEPVMPAQLTKDKLLTTIRNNMNDSKYLCSTKKLIFVRRAVHSLRILEVLKPDEHTQQIPSL